MRSEVAQGQYEARTDYRTLQRIVTDHLRSAILWGELQPGHQLHQAAVAKYLGVSRMPVREAMRILQSEGLVHLHPHQPATVVNLCSDEISEIFDIRIVLEAHAAAIAAPRLSDATIARLHQICGEMDCPSRDLGQWLGLNRDFHLTIYSACGRPRLCAMITHLLNVVEPYIRTAYLLGRVSSVREEHHQMLRAAEDRDAKRLSDLTVQHLGFTARMLVENLLSRRLEAENENGLSRS